jgi:hypothetical protein
MRRGTLYWGGILIVVGFLFLLDNLNIISFNVWGMIWPIFLVALGLWFLFGTVLGRGEGTTEHAVVPLEGAGRARLRLEHGAGRLHVYAGSGDALVEGDFGGGLDLHTRREGDTLNVVMKVPLQFFPFGPWNWGPHGLEWSFSIHPGIPVALDINSGAGEADIDLTDLKVTELGLHTGATSSRIKLPANAGRTRVLVEAGAASVRLAVPAGVAARISNRSGLSAVTINTTRFPRQGEVYQSSEYESAANQVDIEIRTGVGSVDVA